MAVLPIEMKSPAHSAAPPPTEAAPAAPQPRALAWSDRFVHRHIGPGPAEVAAMLKTCGMDSLDAMMDQAVPESIRLRRPLDLPASRSEFGLLLELKTIAARNQVFRSFIGCGYYDCVVPPVIQRNILENPGWYTQYTPYQAEISQGRMEALLNFQPLVMDLTAMEVANASLLDEGTAAAEAMGMCFALKGGSDRNAIFVSNRCHPQTVEVLRTRADSLGVEVLVGDHQSFKDHGRTFAALVQYPDTFGRIDDFSALANQVHQAGGLFIVAADLLSLALLKPPGEFGADVVVGSAQRFGVPLGYGGPHAAFFATRDEFKRQMPGRLIGVSKDAL